ncbi:GntR family transcriptional regulator [Algirhabdus cladophorae]|uniref:GntR family transcriptional regulator n=1 Tax=Algirhabdus cladophorae TaxID=3377108 RepID=UPI003B84A78B
MTAAALLPQKTVDAQDTVIALRTSLKTGNYRPADRLPCERDLIGRLGICRSTLRKAFDPHARAIRLQRRLQCEPIWGRSPTDDWGGSSRQKVPLEKSMKPTPTRI